jgi:hypothetical protein
MCDLIVVERIMTVAMSTLHPIENGAFPLGEGGRGGGAVVDLSNFCGLNLLLQP